MTTIDGDEITGITIDGEEVTEVTMDGDVVWSATTIGGDMNLANAVPQDAWDLWLAQPDDYRAAYSTSDMTTYAGRANGFAGAVETAWGNGNVGDLGAGNEYQLNEPINVSGATVGGMVGDDCTIYWNENAYSMMLEVSSDEMVLKGVTFDISENTNDDAGVLSADITDTCWVEDVALNGQRNRYQSGSTGPRHRYTWIINMGSSGEGFIENLDMSDGEVYNSSQEFGDHCQGITRDPDHHGFLVYKNCSAEDWVDNGFYISHSPNDDSRDSRCVLWDCYAANNRGGGFRIGQNDEVIGGTTEATNVRSGINAVPMVFDYSDPVGITGVTIRGNEYSGQLMRGAGFTEIGYDPSFYLDRVVLEAWGDNRPVRFSGGPNISIFNSYFHYHTGTNTFFFHIWDGTDVSTDDQFRVLSENGTEISVTTSSTITIDGTEYGEDNYTADELGLESPLDDEGNLPQPYFDYSVRL